MAEQVDPITLQVFINILHTISDEMVASLVRTGYSTNIKDRRDCSCAIYNLKGEVIRRLESVYKMNSRVKIEKPNYADRETKYWLTVDSFPFRHLLKID